MQSKIILELKNMYIIINARGALDPFGKLLAPSEKNMDGF
jgi:hypothetical protein